MLDDLRSALRQLRRNPGFACAVVLTLALGVGAVTAILTIADPVLFRPLPFPHAERLFRMSAEGAMLHVPDELRAESAGGAFATVGDFKGPVDVAPIGTAAEISLSYGVTPGFLPALGIQPILGRGFRSDEYASQTDVALITYALWQQAFGGRADVLQQRLTFAGPRPHTYEIVGVLPRAFFFPDYTNRQPVALVPQTFDPTDARPNAFVRPIVRLKDTASLGAATAQMQVLMRSVEQDYPAFQRNRKVRFTPLREALFGGIRTPIAMLLAAAVCILILASANLAQLTTARLRARRREFGIRRAIGASRGRLVRQLLVEVLLLAIAGGLSAFGAGAALSRLATAYVPPIAHAYQMVTPVLDWRIAAITACSVLSTLVVFGVFPAIHAASGEVRDTIAVVPPGTAARRMTGGDPTLIFVQVTMAVTLLVTGLLVVRSFITLATTPVGFDDEGVRQILPTFPGVDFRNPVQYQGTNRRFYDILRARFDGSVAVSAGLPGLTRDTALMRPDMPRRFAVVSAWHVSGAFFGVMRLRLVRGRLFTEDEALSGAPVAVIDQRAATLLWPGVDPLGRTVKDIDGTVRTVVGVTGTVRTDLLDSRFQRGSGFVPLGAPRFWFFLYRPPHEAATERELQSMAARVQPGARVTIDRVSVFERELAEPRFLAIVIGPLTAIALLLTFVGVFGIVTHEVGRRMKEMGIRIALGADGARIQRLVLRGSLLPALAGGLTGLSASLWLSGALRAVLVGVDPYDPTIYALTLLLTLAIVLLGSLGPALRASRTDPMLALRAE
ncbi:MAG: ABC transporter permease [Vicinamibacterales bacterium]